MAVPGFPLGPGGTPCRAEAKLAGEAPQAPKIRKTGLRAKERSPPHTPQREKEGEYIIYIKGIGIVDTLEIRDIDILRIETNTYELDGYYRLSEKGGLVKELPKTFSRTKIHLMRPLDVPVKCAYQVKTSRVNMIGYLLEDGLTIVEY